MDRLKDESAIVPDHWRLQIGNVLVQAERRKRIAVAQIAAYLDLLNQLTIHVDSETGDRAFREILTLARTEGLTTYEAAYLELAMRRGVQLATQDVALVQAAHRVGVETGAHFIWSKVNRSFAIS